MIATSPVSIKNEVKKMIEVHAPYNMQVSFSIETDMAKEILKNDGVALLPEFHTALVEVVVTALDCPRGFRIDIITEHDTVGLNFFNKKSIMLKTENPAFEELLFKAQEVLRGKFYPGIWR